MAFTDYKVNSFSFNHKDQIDELYQVMDSEQVKNSFDSRSETLQTALNHLIDNLASTTTTNSGAMHLGVQPIPGLNGNNVYDLLVSLKDAINQASLGAIATNSITNAKLHTDISIGSLAALNTSAKSSVVSAINEILAMASQSSLKASNVESVPGNTSPNVIISYTPTANKCYEVKSYIRVALTTQVTLKVNYADAGGAQSIDLVSTQTITPGSYAIDSFFMFAIAGTAIQVLATVANAGYVAFTNKLVEV